MHVVLCETKIDKELEPIPVATRDASKIDDAPQHLAPASLASFDKSELHKFRRSAPQAFFAPNGQKNFRRFFDAVPQKRKRRSWRSGVHLQCRAELPHAIALMRALSRDTRRAAAFLATTRASAPRWISGCAALSASTAFFLSPRLDRLLDLLDRAAHAAAARRVRGGAALGLAGALLGRLVISHSILFLGSRRLYEATGGRSTPCQCH